MQRIFLWLVIGFSLFVGTETLGATVALPSPIIADIEQEIKVTPEDGEEITAIIVNGKEVEALQRDGEMILAYTFHTEMERIGIEIQLRSANGETTSMELIDEPIAPMPLWLSIIPPIIAILMALLFKEVLGSLFFGLFIGSALIEIYNEGFWSGLMFGFMRVIDTYVVEAMTDSGHVSVVVFSMLIGAMVSVISKNGGMKGVVNLISRYARSPRSGQMVTWALGVAIFFDDYANTLVVGNTMRPVTDRLKISREKLSYIVDSTAAPVAAIAFVTTWIGAELGYIGNGIEKIPALVENESAYGIFMSSLSYSFYPILTLIFILMLVWKKRDFGPMLKAEQLARTRGVYDDKKPLDEKAREELEMLELDEDAEHTLDEIEHSEPRWYNAVIPVGVVIFGTIAGLVYTGLNATESFPAGNNSFQNLSLIIGNSDSYQALLWSSLAGLLCAVLMTIGQKAFTLEDTVGQAIEGFKTMLTAILILVLAWSLAHITDVMHTADFITQMLSNKISPALIPAFTFVLAALVAFSTGSSWGTMAILYPLMLPASWTISNAYGLSYDVSIGIFYNVVSCVLAGSVLGDHCSPISDTTILSSLASSCNHISHVKTQLPYALTVGGVSILIGTIPAGFGISAWVLFPLAVALLWLIIHFIGKKTEATILQKPEV